MITELQLENLKSFSDRVSIPLAPITLIFGQNSSGKSSVLQALHLLKQTHDSDTDAALLVGGEDSIVDMGIS